MIVVKKFGPTALGTKMRARGGIHVGEALKRAEQAVRDQREGCLAEIDRALARLSEPGLKNPEIYNEASNIVSMCVGDDEALAMAARSLCDQLDAGEADASVDRRAVEVHLAALRTLHRTVADAETQRAVLAGLRRLSGLRQPPPH